MPKKTRTDEERRKQRVTHSIRWRKNNPEKFKKQYKARYDTVKGRLKILLQGAKQRAKKRGLEFDLDYTWAISEWGDGCCKRTNIKFNLNNNGTTGNYSPTIDRIDNSRGYTKDNCQLVIWMYNRAKGSGTDIDVTVLAKALLGFDYDLPK